jgi:hypothetical protein
VAHRARGEDAVPGPEHASFAERVVKDAWDKPTLRVRARSEGRWGNNIWVRFEQSTGAKALLTADLEVGSGEAQVNVTRGFERGALVRVYDRNSSDYIVLTEIGDRQIKWASATPVNRRYRAAGPTYLEVIEVEVHAALRDRRETFRGLQLHNTSRRYVSKVNPGRVPPHRRRRPRLTLALAAQHAALRGRRQALQRPRRLRRRHPRGHRRLRQWPR